MEAVLFTGLFQLCTTTDSHISQLYLGFPPHCNETLNYFMVKQQQHDISSKPELNTL